MFVDILLRDSALDLSVEFESSRHREIFETNSRPAVKKLWGDTLTLTRENCTRNFQI